MSYTRIARSLAEVPVDDTTSTRMTMHGALGHTAQTKSPFLPQQTTEILTLNHMTLMSYHGHSESTALFSLARLPQPLAPHPPRQQNVDGQLREEQEDLQDLIARGFAGWIGAIGRIAH